MGFLDNDVEQKDVLYGSTAIAIYDLGASSTLSSLTWTPSTASNPLSRATFQLFQFLRYLLSARARYSTLF
jgi:hypothetical protein